MPENKVHKFPYHASDFFVNWYNNGFKQAVKEDLYMTGRSGEDEVSFLFNTMVVAFYIPIALYANIKESRTRP